VVISNLKVEAGLLVKRPSEFVALAISEMKKYIILENFGEIISI
jgi:hypothetical protein